MPLKLETPRRDHLAVVVNPLPVRIIGRGPGPPEQVLPFWPFELKDPAYRCIKLITEHTAGRMVKRDQRLLKLREDKGTALMDACERLLEEGLNQREAFTTAFKEVLHVTPPSIDDSAIDKALTTNANQRLSELQIPLTIHRNWPLWWKLMVIEDKALAWENWKEYEDSEQHDMLARRHPAVAKEKESAAKGREARDRTREREKAKTAKTRAKKATAKKADIDAVLDEVAEEAATSG